MKKGMKRALIVLLCTAVAVTGGYRGAVYLREKNQKTIMVVKVGSVSDSYYTPASNLEGTITSNVTQNVKVDKDVVIDQILVEKGQSVSQGEVLMTFDNTLLQMELNIARLKQQKQAQDLTSANARLTSLQNGGPIEDTTATGTSLTNTSSMQAGLVIPGATPFFALSSFPLYLGELISGDPWGDTASYEEPGMTDPVSRDEGGLDSGDGISGSSVIQSDGQSVIQDDTVQYLSPEDALRSGEEEEDEIVPEGPLEGELHFYRILDDQSVPCTGTGTEKNPYVFLCSQNEGVVTVMGSFFNRMAGYNADGTEILNPGGYWFRLEFHKDDSVADRADRLASCISYYYIDGSLLEGAVNPQAQVDLTVEDAIPYQTEEIPDWYGGYSGGSTSTLTRAEAIKIQQMRISSLELDLKDSEIKISSLEKKAAVTEVVSRLDGVVSYVGDPHAQTSINDSFLKIQSAEGYYVRGSVSELMLDQIKVGTRLSCSGYESGYFEAEVIDVSEYPSTGNSYGWYGNTNPNVSYYEFTATIQGDNTKVSDTDWISITVDQEEESTGGIVLTKALVRSENGVSYVYRDVDGVLKKQVVHVKEIVNSGYSVLIDAGLSQEDLIAFPYSTAAVEGTKTQEATVDQFYGW